MFFVWIDQIRPSNTQQLFLGKKTKKKNKKKTKQLAYI